MGYLWMDVNSLHRRDEEHLFGTTALCFNIVKITFALGSQIAPIRQNILNMEKSIDPDRTWTYEEPVKKYD